MQVESGSYWLYLESILDRSKSCGQIQRFIFTTDYQHYVMQTFTLHYNKYKLIKALL